jgi:membrane protein
MITLFPTLIGALGLGEAVQGLLLTLRWPLLLLFFMTALAVVFRYGPSRDEPKWRWVSPGAVVAALLWLVVSGLFSLYVSNFDNFNKTYGSLGAVVILLMWFYLTAYVILLGAEMNVEAERQTSADTTKGHPEPMGQRGAFAADHPA